MVGLHFSPRRRPFVRTRTLADVGKAVDEAFERRQTKMGVALILYYITLTKWVSLKKKYEVISVCVIAACSFSLLRRTAQRIECFRKKKSTKG